ncbi:BTAD domain-containing putative transcriptional regulator [Nocardiopsis baichengensis]|uniref:BTAD domain-containing putative transcriptional regulator n=1 Tax=Nocardiopsis baichengensis TaxID=280240 RepID=UPI00034B48FA|nr:BTAD domain-containing putative transcriptional regulator [Nocardiopsis baichengensis]
MRFGVLGPLAVWGDDGGPVALPDGRVRALLAVLLVHGGRPVPVDRLVEDLWPQDPPGRPRNTLQTKVSWLRKVIGADRVPLSPAGYRLRVEDGEVDADRFERAAAEAGRGGAPGGREQDLAQALGLWRGTAYAEFADAPFARAEAARLAGLRLAAVEALAEARAAAGRAAPMADELAALAQENPLRERLHGLHMLALYQAGRQADAQAAYHGLRRRLRDELGVDPGPEVAGLHARLLRGEAAVPEAPGAGTSGVSGGGSGRAHGNIPAPPASLIGREEDAARVCAALRAGDGGGLVTVTGPGGVGKTRLALAAARAAAGEFPDGVWVVELAGTDCGASASDIAERVISVLGLCDGAADADAFDLVDWVRCALDGRRLLLVLDNCEHVVDPVAEAAGALLAADGVSTVVTGQEALGIPGEAVVPLAPLPVCDAVRLFTERARAASPGFALTDANAAGVAAICRRLDGIPLAVELVAARMRALTVSEALAGLDDRFALPTGPGRGRPTRQQTLRSMVAWSWDLLTGGERAVLRRLSVHRDGWTVEAARAVCPGGPGAAGGPGAGGVLGALSRLVDRSLVVREGERYRLLESVAAYCAERLEEAGETGEVRRRFVAFHVEHAERADPELCGRGQDAALAALDAETVNKRRALELAVRGRDAGAALRLAGALAWFWRLRNRTGEARRSLSAALVLPGGPPQARSRAEAWRAAFEGRAPSDGGFDPRTRLRLLWCARAAGGRLERVPDPAEAGDDRWAEALALVLRAGWRLGGGAGEASAARADAERGAGLFDALGDRWGRLRARTALARALADAGPSGGGVHGDQDGDLGEDLKAAERLGLWGDAVEGLLGLGRLAEARGECSRSRGLYERALGLAVERSYASGAAEARGRLERSALTRGSLDSLG